MAFTLRASTPNSAAWTTGTTFTCATGAAVSVGDLLVAMVVCRGSAGITLTASGITDTSSPANTWTELTSVGAAVASDELSFWYCLSAQQATTPTLTVTLGGGTVSSAYAGVAAFNPGGGTVAVDTTVTNSGALGVGGTSVPIDTSPTGGAPANANSLALWAIGFHVATSGFSSQTNANYGAVLANAQSNKLNLYDWIQTSPTALADTVTMGSSQAWRWTLAAFYIQSPPVAHSTIISQAVKRAAYYCDLGARLPALRRDRARLQALGLVTL